MQQEYLEQNSKEQIQIFSDYNEMLKGPNLDMINYTTPFVHASIPLLRRQANMSTVEN